MRRLCLAVALLGFTVLALADRSVRNITPVDQYEITGFPLYGATVTPSDTTLLAEPGVLRPDADGAVTAMCYGSTTSITLNLVAGEYFPCLVKRVYDTGTDAITIHVFY